jgi:hypothetical protein
VKETEIFEMEVVEFFNYDKSDHEKANAYSNFLISFESSITVIGLVINLIFCFVVIVRRKLNSSLYIFLLNISISDLIVCSAAICLASKRSSWIYDKSEIFCKSFFTIYHTSGLFVSALLTIVPIILRSNPATTTQRCWTITLVCWMTSVVLALPLKKSFCEGKFSSDNPEYYLHFIYGISTVLPFIVTVFVFADILCQNRIFENRFVYLALEIAHIICLTPSAIEWHLGKFIKFEVDNLSSFIMYVLMRFFYGFKPLIYLFIIKKLFEDIKNTFHCKKLQSEYVVFFHE